VHPEINTADLSGLEKEGWGHPISGFFGYNFNRQFVMLNPAARSAHSGGAEP
jgi:hypothetical protein